MYQFRNIEKSDCVSTVCFYFFLGSCLFQLFQNLVRTHAARQQLLQYSLCFGLLSFFSGLSIRLRLLRFQGDAASFSAFFRAVFFSFSVFFYSSIAFWMDAISVFRDAIVSCFSASWDT